MIAPSHPSATFDSARNSDRDAIFGGPMSPPQRNPSQLESVDIESNKMDGSEEFIEIKVNFVSNSEYF